MDVLAVVVMLIALMALASVVVYFVYDYLKYKDSNDKSVGDMNKRVDVEKGDRLSNVKFVVDQVNTVNTDIFNSFSSSNAALSVSLSNVATTQSNMLGGIDKVMTFSSNTSGLLKITDLPGYTAPNIRLIQNVTAVMGFTANDLNRNKSVNMCSSADSNRCIKIPDADGTTLIRNIDSNADIKLQADNSKNIVLDGRVVTNNSLTFTPVAASITTIDNSTASMFLKTGRMSVGTATTPSATMHVRPVNTTDPLMQIDDGSSRTRIVVNKDGFIELRTGDGTVNVATLRPATNGGLEIFAPSVRIAGNLAVTGSISSNVA